METQATGRNDGVPQPPARTGRSDALLLAVDGDPCTNREAARGANTHAVTGALFSKGLMRSVGNLLSGYDAPQSAVLYAADVIDRIAPRDALEEMLAVQLVLAHVRSIHLTSLALEEAGRSGPSPVQDYANKASNTYQRLMLAMKEYRRSTGHGLSVGSIGQANFANNQIFSNETTPHAAATNEQGCGSSRPATVPIDS